MIKTAPLTEAKPVAPKSVPPLDADLDAGLRRLKLAAIRRTAPEVLITAKTQRWTPEEVLRTLVETELAKGLKVTNKVVREASILSMFRVGTKASIPAVDEAIKDTSDKDVKLKLNALKYYLKTRG